MTRAVPQVWLVACLTAPFLLGGATGVAAPSEDVARLELGVGYALLFRPEGQPSLLPVGLVVDLTMNPLPSVGVVAEAGAIYSEGADAVGEITVLGGLRYSLRRQVVFSMEALIGGVQRTAAAASGPEEAWHEAFQVGTTLSFRISPDALLQASVSFRKARADVEPSRSFRFLVGATLGLRRSRGPNASAPAAEPQGIPPPAFPLSGPPGPSADESIPPALPMPPPPSPPAPPSTPVLSTPEPMTPARGLSPTAVLARGRSLLERGLYFEAAAAFRSELGLEATGSFTIAVGVYCEIENVHRLVQGGVGQDLFLLSARRGGRECYAVYWGTFASSGEAEAALSTIPAALRTKGQGPIEISRVLR